MAKKRLKIKDKQGNVIDYDISAASVTIDVEGKSLDVKLTELVNAIASAVTSVTFNGNSPAVDASGNVNLGQQMQADWNEQNTNWPSYVRNKPSLAQVATSGDYNDLSNKPTIPEGAQADTQMSDNSENVVQNKVIKAYVDTVSQRLNTLIGSGNVQGAIDTFNEVKAFLDGIDTDDPTLANQLLALNNAISAVQTSLATKANTADVYTKAQIDEIVAGIEAGEIQVISVDNVVIVDSHTNNTVIAAPSARQMKMMYDNVMAIYDALAGIAFTNGKPTLDWIGNVTTYSMDVTGLTNIVAPTITSFTEGYLATIELSPAAGYSLDGVTINVTDINNQPVSLAQAPTYNSTTGKVVFKIEVNQNFKVSGTAVAAKTISVADAHLHLVPSSVLNGGNYSGTMTADDGYLVPLALSNVSGVSAASITYTRASNGKSATVAINNVTANVTISDAAVQLSRLSISLPSDENINVEDASGNTLSGTQLVYEGDPFTCVIRCNKGYGFANVPAISGQTPTVQTDGSYRFDVDSVTTNISVTATAEAITAFTSGGLNYVLLSGNSSAKVTVKSGTADQMDNANTGDKYTGSIEVPASATYCGASYNVTQIDNFAFYNCTGITAMSLPEGLTYIGSHSFRKTTGMKTCNFPSTLTTIKTQAFRESGLLSIDFSACDALTISAYTFHNCSATSLTFKKGSTITAADKDSVGSYLFNGTKITNLVLNCTFKNTGYYDFMNCAQLETITFTEDYKTVGTDWSLGNAMFIHCAAITDIYVRKTNPLPTTSNNNDAYCPFKTIVRESATVHIPTTATLAEWNNSDGQHNYCWQYFANISQDINLNA